MYDSLQSTKEYDEAMTTRDDLPSPHHAGTGTSDGAAAQPGEWAEQVEVLQVGRLLWADTDAAVLDWHTTLDGGEIADHEVADVGCGAGGMTAALAARVGDRGAVLAVDGEPLLLAEASQHARALGLGDRVQTVAADLDDPAAYASIGAAGLDLVVASSVVHHLADQVDGLTRLTSTLRPGGVLLLLEGGLSPRCLPWDVGVGRPGLENRLYAAGERWFERLRAELPGSVRAPYGWPAMLERAGLGDLVSRSFLLDLPRLTDGLRDAVVAGLRSNVARLRNDLDASDCHAWSVLLDADAPEYLGWRDDISLLAVRTAHRGRRPAA